ncbi:MAG: GNAT family N-acetyltransferase [Pseudomonadota bacterium]
MVSETIRISTGLEQSNLSVDRKHENVKVISEITHANQRFKLTCLRSVAEMGAFEAGWRELETRSTAGFDYFQTFDWCYSWSKVFIGSNPVYAFDTPQVYVLLNENGPVMIWPMTITRSKSGLFFLESMSDPLGQYANILFDDAQVDLELGKKVWVAIKSDTRADAVALNHYPENSFLAKIIGKEGVEETVQFVSSILDFNEIGSWEEYSATLSKSQRKERKRKLRKLSVEGELTFEVHFYDSDEFSGLVNKSVDLKRKWLIETDRHSQALFKDESSRFLASLGHYFATDGSQEGPLVQVLKLDGEPIALEVGMLRQRHYYSYLGAIDLNWAEFSPGKVQIEMSQQWALENGVTKFDFLSDPSDYKKSWSNTEISMRTRYLPITAQGHFYCSFWKAYLKPTLRLMYQRSSGAMRNKINRIIDFAKGDGKKKTLTPSSPVKGRLTHPVKSPNSD